jgi:ABC-2 type transport system permease protein
MMFGAPLLITGLLFLAFGSMAGGGDLDLQAVRVQVANLDQPGTQSSGIAAGQMLVDYLRSDDLADLLEISMAADEVAARQAVESQQADVALIVPADFTAAALAPDREATVVQYEDPTLTIGPGIVEDVVSQFIDGFAGTKITAGVVTQQLAARGVVAGAAVAQEATLEYAAWLESSGHEHDGESTSLLDTRSPAADESAGDGAGTIGAIMIAMTIFFTFFMGASSAESIIREDEEGTLARLFTTPTSQAAILGGKFMAVMLNLIVQVVVLLVASSLMFGISWGQPLTVVLVTLALIVAAAGFGVLLMSFIQNTRQTGPVMGGVLTVTGMLGGLFTSGVPNVPELFDTVRLVIPQGWAMQAWELTLQGASVGEVVGPVAVMFGLGALFFGIGTLLFRRRFS